MERAKQQVHPDHTKINCSRKGRTHILLQKSRSLTWLYRYCLGLGLLLSAILAGAQNTIVTENQQPGTPSSVWDINGAGDLTIQGFATDISVNKGETVRFKIKTNANAYTINIYRLGYYQGNGARFMGTGVITAALPQSQPNDLRNTTTGLVDCGNWAESAHWDVPSTAVSGIYIARLRRTDNGGASHIVFIVRDDASRSDLLFQTSDATWQAYNAYGGNSLYVGTTSFPEGHAVKVSYNRPFVTRDGGGGGGAGEDWLFNAEYPMIRWLERNGYDVTYTTGVDIDRRGNLITNHKVYMSVGHDEYWSAQQRANVEAARNAGVHLAFFSGNEVYWKTRWESSIDASNTPYRTLVCYKEGTEGERGCGGKCDPLSTVWTGLWRDGCAFPTADGCRPENALSGQISWVDANTNIQVPGRYKNLRFWRNTSIVNLGNTQTAMLSDGTLGYEWDYEQNNGRYPAGRVKLSETTVNGQTHKLSLYRHSSGALVFGAGTVQWSWGLDGAHDRSELGSTPDPRIQQATVNLFADMGVQPQTIQAGLVTATGVTETAPPVTTITAPANGATLTAGSPVTITGTATEALGVVAGVEVSVDGGTTWQEATGTNTWSFTWTPSGNGTFTIKSRAFDDMGNMEPAGSAPAANVVTVTVGGVGPTCPCTLFQVNDATTKLNGDDGAAIEVGVKFKTTENGFITGIRFYKAAGTAGTHIGHLWSSSGTKLAEATFFNETASGWQQVNFANPIAVTAGTNYIAAYHSSSGAYVYTDNYFTQAVTNGPLRALANGEDGPNGVYLYTSVPAFPTSTFQSSNYWVDAVFNTTVGPDETPPTIVSTTPASNATGVSVSNSIRALFSEAILASTVNSSTVELRQGSTLVNATISYDAGNQQAVLTPLAPLAYSTTYTVTLKGGSTDPRIKDLAGNALSSNYTWSFTTGAEPPPGPPPPPPPSPIDGPGGPILLLTSTSNPFSKYTVEILRAEGFNAFANKDIGQVTTAADLSSYDVVILGEIAITANQVTLLTDWVTAGGTLIAMRPGTQLASLMGIIPTSSTLLNRYLLVNTATDQGKGIVNQTIQFHGTASLYTLNGATSLATLYSSATAATTNPAITIRNVGTNGGQAIAFAYDLARSVVYSRQGNPAWAGQKRDGQDGPRRSDDMYFGNASFDRQPDWVDLSKVTIPQADEQQRLLTNIIMKGNEDKKPLPRFWFLPRGLKAAVVMSGDDHGNGGTAGRFDQYKGLSPSNSADAVDSWRAVRGTSYIFPSTPITDAEVRAYQADGFEIGLHLLTNCDNWTPAALLDMLDGQLSDLTSNFPGILAPRTNRTHCIAWSDWVSKAKIESARGIRLDVNYYYWPGAWIQNRPGMFTGSGMPMRFADTDGTIIDCYQVATQMTDESDQVYPEFIDALLDKALGPEGYYGVFCANMHTDNVVSPGSDAVVNSALAREIPVISSKQMLNWLDSRNASTYSSLQWNNNTLSFNLTAASGARDLEVMLPYFKGTSRLKSISVGGAPRSFRKETIKGIEYAFVSASTGNYSAVYEVDPCVAPPTATLGATPDCATQTIGLKLSSATGQAPYSVVVNNVTYTGVNVGQNFATVPASAELSIWDNNAGTQSTTFNDDPVELGVRFRVAQNGTITGIRFYKGAANTGTHTGTLWTANGSLLASATFINETASGWQEVRFATPVTVTANTTYIASYFSPGGTYNATGSYFGTGVTNGPLTALPSATGQLNGLFKYGGGFPDQSFNAANYWVDVLFKPNSYTFILTSLTDANQCANTGNISSATVTQEDLQSGQQTYYRDNDQDGFGNPAITQKGCTPPAGYVAQSGDCNDNNAAVKPGATEICDGIDNDCDGLVDEGGSTTYYRDTDGDGFGNLASSTVACTPPAGYVLNSTDCNDGDAAVHPGAIEVCDGKDNDCDNQTDEGVLTTYYRDSDNDGFGNLASTTTSCAPPTGYVSNSTDCNDSDAAIHPNATEVCDGKDNDCDGSVDEGMGTIYYRDADNDTYGTSADTRTACTPPAGYVARAGDCDDSRANVNPGVTEICGNGLDDDCNGSTDDCIPTNTYYRDSDGDGFGDPEVTATGAIPPAGYVSNRNDCNDSDATIKPGAVEVCDGKDNDCDGEIDEGVGVTYYRDADGDGFGNLAITTVACTPPTGYVSNSTDCNDGDATVRPGATELCDGKDNDCDSQIDEGVGITYYRDADNDGYGTSADTKTSCAPPAGYVAQAGDCADNDNTVYPNAPELCDGKDNDCDSQVDESLTTLTYYRDADGDGYGVSSDTRTGCAPPAGYAVQAGDCNDSNPAIKPGATEICDGIDNDCDGQVDEGGQTTYYRDADGDGFGNLALTALGCTPPTGYVSNNTDCNDGDATVRPNAVEVCDGKDNDCDGQIDEGVLTTYYLDADNDGYGTAASSTQSCAAPAGYVSNSTDCNDNDPAINPGRAEVCGNGKDDNCNGQIDEVLPLTYYRDVDGDGFGVASNSQASCTAPAGYVTQSGDCNDNDPTIKPGAAEVCDGKDNDCDGQVDEGLTITTYYRDADGDGYGTSSDAKTGCTPPTGYVALGGDCNDSDPLIRPGASELCDGKDNNCNKKADEGCKGRLYYRDVDGDGYGNPSVTTVSNSQPAGYVLQGGDCNDNNQAVHPGATEICGDGIDNDCDGLYGEGCPVINTYYRDADGDGYGNPASSSTADAPPPGYVANNADCRDDDAAVNPAATEVCDGKDNDCDGSVDENCPPPADTYYRDADGDSYGDPANSVTGTEPPPGYVANNADCRDDDATIHPGVIEVCDGKDNDCDGQVDEGVLTTYYRDMDGDGFGSAANTTTGCTRPTGYVGQAGDCNDNNAAIKPGATEVCDGIDNDCDGTTDEGCMVSSPTVSLLPNNIAYESDGVMTISVFLSQPNTQPVTVNYASINGTASSPKDYKAVKGILTIPAGSTTGAISVTILRDNLTEGPESFTVRLSNPVNATIGTGTTLVTIQDGSRPVTKTKAADNTVEAPVVPRLTATVSPNPAPYYFTLVTQSSNQEPVTIRVMDLLGRVVETKQSVPANGTIQLGHKYRTGTYFAELTQGKVRVMVKLLKGND